MRHVRRRRALRASVVAAASAVAACLAATTGAPSAAAQVTAAPSLMGENLFAGSTSPLQQGTFKADADCNADGSGTITFFASGVAVGPYPGTFTESGTVTFGPPTGSDIEGNLITIDASFTIVSEVPEAIINGTKTLRVITAPEGRNEASCLDGENVELAGFVTAVSYEATIDTPTGTFQDSGSGNVDAQDVEFSGTTLLSEFRESFTVSDGVVVVATEGNVTGGGWIGSPTTEDQVSFGFQARNDANGLRGNCTVIDHAADVRIKCLTVTTLVQAGTHAYFSGQAVVNGVIEKYRIDVDDLGEPSTADTFKIVTDSYTRGGVLTGGNIQIHEERSS